MLALSATKVLQANTRRLHRVQLGHRACKLFVHLCPFFCAELWQRRIGENTPTYKFHKVKLSAKDSIIGTEGQHLRDRYARRAQSTLHYELAFYVVGRPQLLAVGLLPQHPPCKRFRRRRTQRFH